MRFYQAVAIAWTLLALAFWLGFWLGRRKRIKPDECEACGHHRGFHYQVLDWWRCTGGKYSLCECKHYIEPPEVIEIPDLTWIHDLTKKDTQ